MGGICSRKREQEKRDNGVQGAVSGRYCKSGSSKWLAFAASFSLSALECPIGRGNCPSLLELCIYKIRKDIEKHSSFSTLPRDLSQQIFNYLASSHSLNEASLKAFQDCALEDIFLGEYPGVKDSWMNVISSQGPSLLSIDLSGSDVTDSGFCLLKNCLNLQALTYNYCDQISELGLNHISGLSNLKFLSLTKNNAVTAEGMRTFSRLVNLMKLDVERCSQIHGGFVHLKGLSKLESLNVRCCKCITDYDMKHISGLASLKELQVSCTNITDVGVSYLKGLNKLILLNLEGCRVTTACLDSMTAFLVLSHLNLSRCGISDDGCEKFSDLTKLESLNLDSCKIGDEGLTHFTGLVSLRRLELSDTEVQSHGLCHLSGLTELQSINLSFTSVTDSGLKRLSRLTSLKSLNLDARQISDSGLSYITGLTGLTHLDLFGARITDLGTISLQYFKNLRSLEICGGGLTDTGVNNIKGLISLRLLNLSQNLSLSDNSLKLISGLTALVSLNVSNSSITSEGLQFLKPLKNLRSLLLESCKVTALDIKDLKSTALPNLLNFRPDR
ncbi:Leucine-rich repeat [Dillenia turbinata]|uniref:Leucine-rich repeat n=1 Tax=Dillenia turbinata TaxID=194707 RepID=A0AAN8VXI8_9MAGN